MNTYLTLFLGALSSALFLTPVVRRLARRFNLLDVPEDGRRVHREPVPRLGGIAIFLSVMISLGILLFLDNLVTESLRDHQRALTAVLASSTLIFLFGVFDDLVGTNAKWKFLAQGIAGAVLYALGGRIEAATLPFAGSIVIPPVLSLIFTLVWVIGISNAFNLIDGMDGLAAGAALFATIVMLVVSFMLGHPYVTVISFALAGSLIGFLRYNFNPASIFLGDSGSLFIGFLLAALSLTSAQKASTAIAVVIPLMAFGLPVLDTGFTIVRRFMGGKPLFEGDREHIHHKLLERGWSQRRVAFVLYGVCALFGFMALLFTTDNGSGRFTGLVLLVVGSGVVLVAGRLRYHEVDEVRAGLRRNLSERRLRVANNIRVRRASQAMAEASTLEALFTSLEEMLEIGEFVYARVQLGRGGDAARSERAFAREQHSQALKGVELRGGLIHWEWKQEEEAAGAAGVVESGESESHLYWNLRLPLSTHAAGWGYLNLYREFGDKDLSIDVNYLSNLFRKEMSRAAERILSMSAEKVSPEEPRFARISK